MPFVRVEIIREMLVGVVEFNGLWIPPQVQACVDTIFGLGSSLINELGNRELRARLSKGANHAIAPQTSWKTLIDNVWT